MKRQILEIAMDNTTPEGFLEYVVKSLVDNPDDVTVEKQIDEMGVLLTLDVNQEDMGKIIGKKGATAKAIRTLLRVVGMKQNARVNMKIKEPEGGMPSGAADEAGGADASSGDMESAMEDVKSEL